MGMKRDMTTAYHPQHNGKIERRHRSLKNALRARLLAHHRWVPELPWVLLGLRSAPNLDTGVSPCLLVLGQQPVLPGQLVIPRKEIADPTAFSERLALAMKAQVFNGNPWHGGDHSSRPVPTSLKNTSCVLVRNDRFQGSLAPKYNGPFEVLARSDKYFTILRYEHHDKISVDRLKPFHEPSHQTTRPAQTLFQTPTGTAFIPKRISKPPDRLHIHGHSDNKNSDISSTVSPFFGLGKGIVEHNGSWKFNGAAGAMRSTPTLCTTAHQFIYTLTVPL